MAMHYPSTFYTHVKVNIPHDLMKHVIGTDGKWFKCVREKCEVFNIWFNKERNIVEIWGPIANLMQAHYVIQNRINVIKDRFVFEDTMSDLSWPADEYHEFNLKEHDTQCDNAVVKRLIGVTGHNFKKITRESGVSFIWYNPTHQLIQIWGLEANIEIANTMLIESMHRIMVANEMPPSNIHPPPYEEIIST